MHDWHRLEDLSPDKSIFTGLNFNKDHLFRTDLNFPGHSIPEHLTERHISSFSKKSVMGPQEVPVVSDLTTSIATSVSRDPFVLP